MPVHPIQFTNPGGHCFCPPFTCLNQETGTLVPIAVPVITKKNLLFPPTPTISTSVLTEVVPVPKESVPGLSH